CGMWSAWCTGRSGNYDIYVVHVDENDGRAHFEVSVGGAVIDAWDATQDLGSPSPGPTTRVRRRVAAGLAVATGTSIQIVGRPQMAEFARVDVIEFVRR